MRSSPTGKVASPSFKDIFVLFFPVPRSEGQVTCPFASTGPKGEQGEGMRPWDGRDPGRIRPASAPTFSLSMAVWKAVWKKGLEGGFLRRLRHPFDSRKVIPRALT